MSDIQKPIPFLNQDYSTIYSNLLKTNALFDDNAFPAVDNSLFKFQKKNPQIQWKRPHEICKDPQFIVNQIEANDLDQGQLGDCWLIASAASVLTVPTYYQQVIPAAQSFEKGKYAGIFHFRFFQYGKWIDIVIDDKLPVINNRLIYCHNNVDTNEFFGPLLEKAYAKMSTCYEFLIGGNACHGFVDMTGGVNETFSLKKPAKNEEAFKNYLEPNLLWELIFRSYKLKSLASTSIETRGKSMESVEKTGLVLGHAYGILHAVEIIDGKGLRDAIIAPSNDKSIKLLRLRNPWGIAEAKNTWNGNWCKSSPEWSKVSAALQATLKANDQSDGQFYISFEDFLVHYDSLDLVHTDFNAMYNKASSTFDLNFASMPSIENAWVIGKNSGGCGNGDPKKYWTNPQFPVTFQSVNANNGEISVVVSLMQTESMRLRAESNGQFGSSFEGLAFRIYAINNGAKPGNNGLYEQKMLTEVSGIGVYSRTREVSKRSSLRPGTYVIIPSLFDKDKNMKFVIRIFYETSAKKPQSQPVKVEPPQPQSNKVDPQPEKPKVLITNANGLVKDKYDTWFYAGYNDSQIASLMKEAQLASERLLRD